MDINKALKTAVSTGKVLFGYEQTMKALKTNKAKLIIISRNCPDDHLNQIDKQKDVPYYKFSGNNVELGSACGKPFSVSMLSVLNPGESEILALGSNK
jgi:large subunit ribosomal protein L30e